MLKNIFQTIVCVALGLGFSSCDKDDLYLGSTDNGMLASPDGNVVYIVDARGNDNVSYVDFSKSYTLDLYLKSSKKVTGTASVTLTYDESVLERYNKENALAVAAFPKENVTLASGGKISLAEGAVESAPMGVTLTSAPSLQPENTYAVPLKVTTENAVTAGGADSFIILVRDCTKFPGTEKFYKGNPGMKIVGVIEVNDVNPLNTMGFTLKDSGKQFFDVVVLFSANINFNEQTGRVYVSRNDNVQALLDQREKYIKPLQERGIKVVLGILGNHDVSGISTLSDEMSKEFAKEVKHICDAYELDGVFLDDEYSDYDAAASGLLPGFKAQSTDNASRMAYEIHKIQPERLLMGYRYEALFSAVAVDGMQPGSFFDYVCNDYWVTSNPCETYPGLRQNQAGTGSWNCSSYSQCIPSNDNWTERFSLSGMRDQGYGALMIFNFRCDPGYGLTRYILKDMQEAANTFWEEDLEYDNVWYTKDF